MSRNHAFSCLIVSWLWCADAVAQVRGEAPPPAVNASAPAAPSTPSPAPALFAPAAAGAPVPAAPGAAPVSAAPSAAQVPAAPSTAQVPSAPGYPAAPAPYVLPPGYQVPPGYVLVEAAPEPEEQSERERARQLKRYQKEQRAAQREAQHQAQREARKQAEASALAFRNVPRIRLSLGVAPVLLARTGRDGEPRRYRQRVMTIGLGLQRHWGRDLGLRGSAEFGIGGARIGTSDEYDGPVSRRVAGPSYSFAFDAAPIFGPFGAFYLAPGVVFRSLWAKRASAHLRGERGWYDDEVYRRDVNFKMPLLMLAARLGMGVMVGDERRFDVGWGFDLGRAFGSADRAFGVFARAGVALGPKVAPAQ